MNSIDTKGPGTVPDEWQTFFLRKDYPGEYRGNPAIIREILSLWPSLQGRRILEVGPGSGQDASRLIGFGARTTVIDPTSIVLQRISRLHPGLGCVQGDGFALPFRTGCFDLVYSQGLLEHWPDPIEMLREQVRVISPGGYVIVDVPQTFSLWTVKKKLMQAFGKWFVSYETQYSERRLRKLAARVSGVRIVRLYGHKLSPSLLPQPKGESFERSWLGRHLGTCIGIVLQRAL